MRLSRRTIVSVAFSAVSIFCLTCIAFAQEPSKLQLIPQPKEARLVSDIPLSGGIAVDVPGGDAEDKFAAQDLQETLRSYGIPLATSKGEDLARVVLLRQENPETRGLLLTNRVVFDPQMHDEGYALIPRGNTLYVIGETAAGVFLGLAIWNKLDALLLALAVAVAWLGSRRRLPVRSSARGGRGRARRRDRPLPRRSPCGRCGPPPRRCPHPSCPVR